MNRPNPFKNGPAFQNNQPKQNHRKGPQFHNQNQHNSPPAPSNITTQPPSPQAPEKTKSGACVVCKAVTVLICGRCGDFYCSPACQKNDWQNHRFICFAMPPLVSSATDILQNLPSLNGYQNRELPECVQPSTSQAYQRNNNNTSTMQQQNQNSHQQMQNQKFPQHSQNNRQPTLSDNQNSYQQSNRQPPQQSPNNRQQTPQLKRSHPPQNDSAPPPQNRQSPSTSIRTESEKSPDNLTPDKAVNIGKVVRCAFPKNNSRVLVTAIRSSNRIFIRSIEKQDNDIYVAAIKTINDYGRNASPLKVMPSRNSFAITDFNNDGLYYRVQVVQVIDADNIQVIYFDYGNEATKKLSELKDISLECAALPQYVNMAVLKNVPQVKDNPKIIDYLKQFEENEAKIVYSENTKDKPLCEIHLDGVEDSLNKKVNLYIQKLKIESETNNQENVQPRNENAVIPPAQENKKPQPTPVETKQQPKKMPSQLMKPVMSPPFERITLTVKAKNLDVLVVDNELMSLGYFACVLVEDQKNLEEIQKYLREYEDTGRAYKPKIEEYCLAKYQEDWYRAKVLSLTSKIAEVVFIDFLNETEVLLSDIRRYPMDLDLPCKTSLCMINGLPEELDANAVEFLKNKIQPGIVLKVNEVMQHEDDNIVICQMKEVSRWLAEFKP